MIKDINITRLDEILNTVNTNIIKNIKIIPRSNHIPNHLDWYEVIIGTMEYHISMLDIDPYHKQEGINLFEQMIQNHVKRKELSFIRPSFKYYGFDINNAKDNKELELPEIIGNKGNK